VIVVLVPLLAGTVWFVSRWSSRGPKEASVDDAVDRFRSSSSLAPPSGVLQPRAGVYTFTGEGDERLSFLSTGQSQGPEMPGTIRAGKRGCWTFEIEYNSFHRQSWDWCVRDGRLVERGGTTHQQFDFVAFQVDETSDITCRPPFVVVDPVASPGAVRPVHCTGASKTTDTEMSSDGTSRFIGRESLDIGAATVPALHYRMQRAITGEQTGKERTDMWFAAADGMPLRNERRITVVSPAPAPLDSVTYTEQGAWQLASVTPRT
jgi:hypothetical protein